MRASPDNAAYRRRREVASAALVVGFAWTLLCLVLAEDAVLPLLRVVPLWLGGVAAIAAGAVQVLRRWEAAGRRPKA